MRDLDKVPPASLARPSLALLALAVLGLACHPPEVARARAPNVILVTIDTLRADHLGIDGYPVDTSPNLDALARAGSYFTACYSQSAATGPSHASLFTSNYPQSTGVRSNEQQFPELPSLISVLRAEGYIAAGFVSSVVLGRKFGIQRTFDHFDDQATTVEANRRDRESARPPPLSPRRRPSSNRPGCGSHSSSGST